jgi:uncharacterized protein (UPF0276 family)
LDGQLSLEKLLQIPEGVKAFQEFLAGEFSVENILFYFATRDFAVGSHQMSDALEIYTTFVERGCRMEVNLPSLIVDGIKKALQQGNSPIIHSFLYSFFL